MDESHIEIDKGPDKGRGKGTDKGGGELRRRLLGAALFFTVATVASRLLGVVREVVVASAYGTSPEASAFAYANLIPSTLRVVIGDAALSVAFVPAFVALLSAGRPQEAWQAASRVLSLMAVATGVLTLGFFAGAPLIIEGLFGSRALSQQTLALTVELSYILFPTLILLSILGVLTAVLNARGRFSLPALAPLAWNLVIILFIIFWAPRLGIFAYAWGLVAGTVAQAALVGAGLGRDLRHLRPDLGLNDPQTRRILAGMVPAMLTIGLINFNGLIDAFFTKFIDEAAMASLTYAFRLYQMPEALFAVALGTVLFPTLAALAAQGNRQGLGETVSLGLRGLIFLMMPLTAFILVLNEPLIRLAYERGAFSANSTALVAPTLAALILGSLFSGCASLLMRALFSLGLARIAVFITLGNLALNIGLNALFLWLFNTLGLYPLIGIALSASTVSLVTFFALLFYVRSRVPLALGTLAVTFGRAFVLSGLLAGGSYWVWHSLGAGAETLFSQAASLAAASLAGLILYTGGALLLRMPELTQVVALVRRR